MCAPLWSRQMQTSPTWHWSCGCFIDHCSQERGFRRCNKMIPEPPFDPPDMKLLNRSCLCRSFLYPPTGRSWLPVRKEIGSLYRLEGGAVVALLEMSARSASWLGVTSGLGKFLSVWVSARQLTSRFGEEGGHWFLELDWVDASDCIHCVPLSHLEFSLSSVFPPVCGTEFDLSLVLRSKKKSFLLMFAIRHMQCRGRRGTWRRAILAYMSLSWPHCGHWWQTISILCSFWL